MGVQVNQTAFDDRVYNLTESIATAGFAPDMSVAPGSWGQEIRKSPGLQINGGTAGPSVTDPTIQVSFVDAAGAGAGASFVESYNEAAMATGDKFLYPLSQLFAHGVSDFEQLAIQRQNGANIDPKWADSMLIAPPKNFWHVFSSLLWDNGMGIQGVGDGAYNTATTTIKFLNWDSTHRFHKGQRIAFADPGQTVVRGKLVTARVLAGGQNYPKIVGLSRMRGEITVDVAPVTAVPTVVNTDWIVPASFFRATVDGNPELAYREPTKGFFAITPLTDEEIAQPIYGVNQTTDEEARAGIRFEIPTTATIEAVISEMATLLTFLPVDAMAELQGTMYFPSALAKDVMDALFRSQIRTSELTTRVDAPSLFMLGVARQAAEFPTGHKLALVSDKMLSNPFVTKQNDKTFVVILNDSWGMKNLGNVGFLEDGVPVGGRGRLRQVVGNQQAVAASFGARHVVAPFGGAGKVLLLTNDKSATRFTF